MGFVQNSRPYSLASAHATVIPFPSVPDVARSHSLTLYYLQGLVMLLQHRPPSDLTISPSWYQTPSTTRALDPTPEATCLSPQRLFDANLPNARRRQSYFIPGSLILGGLVTFSIYP